MTTESGSAPLRAINPLSAIAIAVVATLGVLYVVSQFLRNSVGVIAPDLAAEIGLTPIEHRAALQHLFLRIRRDAIAARRGARPFRPQALHAGVDRIHGAGLRAVRGGA